MLAAGKFYFVLIAGLLTATSVLAAAVTEPVVFESQGHMLYGCITRPQGSGPFPAMIYNHGLQKRPPRCGPPDLAKIYVDRGYLFFAFQRSGHGQSPGAYIGDLIARIKAQAHDQTERDSQVVALHEAANLNVVDAVEWLLARPEVDRRHVALSGLSFGGIQTVLTAEKGLGLRGFVAFAAGAKSWWNIALRERLATAIRNAQAPLFLLQAENDFGLGPSEVLGPQIRAKGSPNDAKLYPSFGTTHKEGHGGFAKDEGGIAMWEDDVFKFLDAVMK